MAHEEREDFNTMLKRDNGMPKMQIVTDQVTIDKYGGNKMCFASPIMYDEVIRKIPFGKILTVEAIRDFFARKNGADFTDSMTAGIFVSIIAWASHQRPTDKIAYWRVLKDHGELNPKYPGGIEAQKTHLEAEGHIILRKGRKNIRYYVKDYQDVHYDLMEEA